MRTPHQYEARISSPAERAISAERGAGNKAVGKARLLDDMKPTGGGKPANLSADEL